MDDESDGKNKCERLASSGSRVISRRAFVKVDDEAVDGVAPSEEPLPIDGMEKDVVDESVGIGAR